MPIHKGAVTASRYFVVEGGKGGKDPRRALANGLRKLAFEPLDRDGDEDRGHPAPGSRKAQRGAHPGRIPAHPADGNRRPRPMGYHSTCPTPKERSS